MLPVADNIKTGKFAALMGKRQIYLAWKNTVIANECIWTIMVNKYIYTKWEKKRTTI